MHNVHRFKHVRYSHISRLDLYLSACQLGITLASLGLGAVLQPAVMPLIEPLLHGLSIDLKHKVALTLALAISTTLHIIIGEQAPKNWSIQFADRILPAIAPPLMLFTLIFYPLISLLNRATNGLLSVVGVKVRPELHGELPHTEDELRALLVHAKDEDAKGFYEHFNFEPSPSDPYHLLLIMKDLMRILGRHHT